MAGLRIAVAILVVIASLIIVYNLSRETNPIFSTDDTPAEDVEQQIRTQVTYVPINVSFAEILNGEAKEGKTLKLTGYLLTKLEGSNDSGYFVDFALDDYNKTIPLKFVNSAYKNLTTRFGKTDKLFNISGVYVRKFPAGYDLRVISIVETPRPVKQVVINLDSGKP